jgi:S1-C subfamily serine protease
MRKVLVVALPVLLLFVGNGFPGSEQERIRIVNPSKNFGPFGGVRLGIIVSEINPHLQKTLKIESGVMVEEVLQDSPAEKAGVQEGDIILKVGNEPVRDQSDVREQLKSMGDDQEVELQILRDGEPLTLQVKPEEKDPQDFNIRFGRNFIGVNLQELDTDLAGYFKVDPNAGVLVTSVESDSPASKAGIRSGDILTHFNGKKIHSPEEVREEINSLQEGETAEITLVRQGNEQKITMKPEVRSFHGREFMKGLPEVMNFATSPEFKEEMENLKRQMEELKRELEDLKQELKQ